MKHLSDLTREELIAKCRSLQAERERLYGELDRLSEAYVDLELKLDSLMAQKSDGFIENYMKFYIEKG